VVETDAAALLGAAAELEAASLADPDVDASPACGRDISEDAPRAPFERNFPIDAVFFFFVQMKTPIPPRQVPVVEPQRLLLSCKPL
jgi:hypothetical protein